MLVIEDGAAMFPIAFIYMALHGVWFLQCIVLRISYILLSKLSF